MHSVLGQITPAEQRKHFQLSVDVADEQCRLSSSLIPTQAISWPRAAFLRIQSCYLQLINSCHGGGPALGQAGGLSRLDRWRSWVNEIKRFLVITLSD